MDVEDTQFREQGGAATMDPSAPLRWLSSHVMRRMANPELLQRRRVKAEAARQRRGARHEIEYFHQVDDGYSLLAAQLLEPLLERYDVELVCHPVGGPTGANAPEPERLLELACRDAAAVAPHYGLEFPPQPLLAQASQVSLASRILAAVGNKAFPRAAVEVGMALFAGNDLQASGATYGVADDAVSSQRLASAGQRRAALGHYSGGMFYYAGEWYWGVDRIYHLENRLAELGARNPGAEQIAPRPPIAAGELRDTGSLTLEFYPSLRSPYTSIIYDATIELAATTGVKLALRPVLPMVMRGVPATRDKGRYIFSDAAREALALGLDWGKMYDPIGEPVRRCYALFPWAQAQGKGVALLGEFLKAAFVMGINTNNDPGLRVVVENAGLDWTAARSQLASTDWQPLVEANRLAMYEFGCWGVPSYRLLDARGSTRLALWGQDRLWLVAREIQRALQAARD